MWYYGVDGNNTDMLEALPCHKCDINIFLICRLDKSPSGPSQDHITGVLLGLCLSMTLQGKGSLK